MKGDHLPFSYISIEERFHTPLIDAQSGASHMSYLLPKRAAKVPYKNVDICVSKND